MPQPRLPLNDDRIVALYRGGASLREIARIFNTSHPTILRRLRLAGVELRDPIRATRAYYAARNA